MMRTQFSGPLLAGFLSLAVAGCSDDPGPLGVSLIPLKDQLAVADTAVAAVFDTTFRTRSVNGYGFNVLLGKSGDVAATALVQFTKIGLPDTLGSVQLDTARLQLYIDYAWNASPIPASLQIREVKNSWSESSFTIDSLSAGLTGSAPVGTLSDTMGLGKTVYVLLDTNFARKWITYLLDTSKTSPASYGMAITNTAGLPEGGIWGFSSFQTYGHSPQLTIKFSKNGRRDSVALLYGEDTFVLTRLSAPLQQSIDLQGGLALRGKVRFDLSFLRSRVGINNAELQLTLNSDSTAIGAGTPDSLRALLGAASIPDSVNGQYYTYGYRRDKSQTDTIIYTFPLTYLTQRWVNGLSPNEGIVFRIESETWSADRVVFYSTKDSAPARRPRLLLTYTRKQ